MHDASRSSVSGRLLRTAPIFPYRPVLTNGKCSQRSATEEQYPCNGQARLHGFVRAAAIVRIIARHRAVCVPDRRLDSLRIERARTNCDAF